MRVLLVTSFGFPHLGGLAQYMRMLKNSLESRGHYVEVLSLNQSWSHYQLLRTSKRVRKDALHSYIRSSNYRGFRQATSGMPKYIQGIELRRRGLELAAKRFGIGGFDIIHSQDVVAAIAMAKVPAQRAKRITTIHGIMAGEAMHAMNLQGNLRPQIWKYLYLLDRYGALASDATIVPAYWLKNVYLRNFSARARIVTVPHGVNPAKFAPTKRIKRTIRTDSSPVIFNGQRLEPYKGHRYMLQALGQLKSSRWRAYIAGNGSLRQLLLKVRNQNGLQRRVKFLGVRTDIPSLLRQSDIVVVPSYVETFGLAVVEAQLAGKPVVGFRTTGVAEIVQHGKTGLLSPYGNVPAMRQNIKRLLDNPGLRQRMGKAARARALKKWTLSRMVSDTLSVYRSATRQSGVVPPDNLMASRIQPGTAKSKLRRVYQLYCQRR